MKAGSDLILTNVEGEAKADVFLQALGTIAYGAPIKKKKKKRIRIKTVDLVSSVHDVDLPSASRFFFEITPTTKQFARAHKKKFTKKKLDHIDEAIVERAGTYKDELPARLVGGIDTVRDFFLSEIAPLVYSYDAGTLQASQVIQKVLSDTVDPSMFKRYEKMLNVAIDMKMSEFIATQLGLSKSKAKDIMATVNAVKPKKITVPVPSKILAPSEPSSAGKAKRHSALNEPKKEAPRKHDPIEDWDF